MSVPDLYDYSNSWYNQYSIPLSSFSIPSHFDTYLPDNQTDYQCRVVLVPSQTKGATAWTLNGKYITIGVYRDQGRIKSRASQLTSQSWSRSGTKLTFISSTPHGLVVGDACDFTNINVTTYTGTVTSIIDENTFMIRTLNTGTTSGGEEAICWPQKDIDYYSDNIVFRLLPSFKLVDWATIQNIFDSTAPVQNTNTTMMYDISKQTYTQVTATKSEDFSYALSTSNVNSDFNARFNQQFDASGDPLTLNYAANGEPTYNKSMNSPTLNNQIFYNYGYLKPDGTYYQVHIYDFYGLDINDPTRGPWYTNVLIYRDINTFDVINNMVYSKTASGAPYYSDGWINDEFGNAAIGIQYNNALVVRKQVLPLALDSFNKPTKSPTTLIGL